MTCSLCQEFHVGVLGNPIIIILLLLLLRYLSFLREKGNLIGCLKLLQLFSKIDLGIV